MNVLSHSQTKHTRCSAQIIQLLAVLPRAACADAITWLTGKRNFTLTGNSLQERDTCVPVQAPATCERSCSPGNVQCVNAVHYYNPSASSPPPPGVMINPLGVVLEVKYSPGQLPAA